LANCSTLLVINLGLKSAVNNSLVFNFAAHLLTFDLTVYPHRFNYYFACFIVVKKSF